MAKFRTDQIRNIAVLGHSSSGKTTLTEALLYKTGAISRMGTVEDGSTVSDWDDEEQKRGISINMSVIPVEFEGYKLNFLDTPGYLDFMGEIISALHVSEATLLLVDAVSGVEVGTELAWDRVSEVNQTTVVFVNKMDRENANFNKAIDEMRETFGDSIVPFQLPIGEAEDFKGIVSLVDMKAYMGSDGTEGEIPTDMMDAVEAGRKNLMETAAESDDELIMKYLEGEELTPDEMRRGLLQGVQSRGIIPVYCGSTTGDIGLNNLARALTRYVPNPAERFVSATQDGSEIEISGDANGPLVANIFKTTIDRYVGRMSYVRVFSGTLNKDDNLEITRTGESHRIANLFAACGKELDNTDTLAAGDIGVISKVDVLSTGDTLTDGNKIALPAAEYPLPLYGVAVAPATKADSAKMGHSLSSLTEEDSTLRIDNVRTTKQTVLQGMGGTHMDVAVARLDSMFGVKVTTAIPKVPYQETVMGTGSSQYRHKKQSGGAGQFAEVHMRVEPADRGEGFSYISEVFGGAISQVFLPSIEKGVRQVMDLGVIAGFPVVDIKAIVFDGKEHPVDSKDIAFQTAGREVFKQAVQEAQPVLLEPIYSIRVVVPEEYMGDVMGDFSTRRGTVQGMEQQNNRSVVRALVPQAEILRYDTDLRSMTQGRGIYSIEFDHYEPVPRNLIDDIIAQHQMEEEAAA